MHFTGLIRAERAEQRIARHAVVRGGFRRVNVRKQERIFVGVRAIRITADAVVIILIKLAAETVIRHVRAHRINAVHVRRRIGQQGQRVEIRPAFAHAGGLEGVNARAAAHEPGAQAVRVFVQNNLRVQRTVPGRRSAIEHIHLHPRRATIRRRGHVGVVGVVAVVQTQAVLGVGLQGIVAQAAATEVVGLEIAGGFGEPELIQGVVHPVVPIKQLNGGGLAVIRGGGGQIQREIEHA